MKYASISSIAALVMMWPVAVTAAPPHLKGEYAVTGMAICQYSGLQTAPGAPFNGQFTTNPTNSLYLPVPLTTSPNGVFFSTYSIQGVRTFDGRGNGTMKGRSVDIIPPPSLNPRVGMDNVFFKFTYSVDSAGGVTTQLVPGSFVATILDLNGNPTSETWTLDRFSLTGLIGNNNSVLTLDSVSPQIETQTYLTGPQAGQSRQRICIRSRTLIRMGNEHGDDRHDDKHDDRHDDKR